MPKQKASFNSSSIQGSMKPINRTEIHSAEMQEIIGRMPHWMISSGISLVFVIVIVLLAGTWFIAYPDVVSSTITLTSEYPPVSIIAHSSGKLSNLLVKDGQMVSKGDYLGLLENTAELSHVLRLKKKIPKLQEFLNNFDLKQSVDLGHQSVIGEMQNSYEVFLKNYLDYLYFSKLMPKENRQRTKRQMELKHSFNNLLNALGNWENKYVLQSPEKGIITFTRFWSNKQNVMEGDKVFIVKPEYTGEWIGQLILPARISGKVKIGQRVKIKLNRYPFMEFGFIWGQIRSRAKLPVGNKFMLEISFPWGLKTTQNKSLDLTHGIREHAEILTENKRLLQRILSPLELLLKQKLSRDKITL